jgi:RNA-directed DNA polymerase
MDKVRELQRELWSAAKRSRNRRFALLYDKVYRMDFLWEAWSRVRANGGAPGLDGKTIQAIEEHGVEEFLEGIQKDLKAGEYWPPPVRRQHIPKPDGKTRPLGIPTVRDRVVQTAVKLVIEPLFEADFEECSYGFRPKRSAQDALNAIRKAGNAGHDWVVDADIEKYFDSIDHVLLMQAVQKRVTDPKVLKLIRRWLKAGVMENGVVTEPERGTPQGGVISPLLSNIYLGELDRTWRSLQEARGTILIRYADDFVVMCRTEEKARAAKDTVEAILKGLKLRLHPDKTRVVNPSRKGETFTFLGCTHKKARSRVNGKKKYLYRWPSPRSVSRIRERVREGTDPRRYSGTNPRTVLAELRPILMGWAAYFRTGNASTIFAKVECYVWYRLNHLLHRRSQRAFRRLTYYEVRRLGLPCLQGTIRYPGGVHARIG